MNPTSTGSIYSKMMGSVVAMAESQRRIGSYGPAVAKIETQLRRGRKDLSEDIKRIDIRLRERAGLRRERLSLIGSLYKIGKTAEINLEQQKQLESGARLMDIEMPQMNLWQKFKTAIMGPDIDKLYGSKIIPGTQLTDDIPGKYLLSLGRIMETDPEQGTAFKEFLDRWQRISNVSKRFEGK